MELFPSRHYFRVLIEPTHLSRRTSRGPARAQSAELQSSSMAQLYVGMEIPVSRSNIWLWISGYVDNSPNLCRADIVE
jgi:hypothetical protein